MINTKEGQSAELRQFNGVMDKDNPLKDVAPGNYLELRNCRNSVTNRVERMKGFQQVMNPYMYLGTNKVIGQHEDLKDNSIIFLQYNSLGYHGIFRWFRNVPNAPYGVIEKIIQINQPQLYTSNNPNPLDFSPDSLITGTALVDNYFFYNDYRSSPKVIDIVRANETDKHREFNINLNKASFTLDTLYTINIYEFANPVPIFTTSWSSLSTTRSYQARVNDFVNAIELLTNVPFEIISCINSVKIKMSLEGRYFAEVMETTSVAANQRISLVTPENFYADIDLGLTNSYRLFQTDLIERMRPVPFIEPTVAYATEPSRTVNLVSNKVFQFRCQYVYFDYAKSTWGAISNIAIPKHSCSDNNYGNEDNYIQIDYSDPRLEDASLVSVIKYVNLAVREHNTGTWQLVKTFEQHEFAGAGQANFRFYNDGNYAAIDQAETTLPYYSVPLNAKSLEIVDDRLFDFGIIEGYDKPCADVKFATEYLNVITPSTYKLTGKAYIKNKSFNGGSGTNDVFQAQPVWKDLSTGDYYWGGFYRLTSSEATSAAVAYNQSLPLGGWVAYMAGTNFFAITTQKFLGSSPTAFGLTVEATTGAIIFDISSQQNRQQMWDYLDYLFNPNFSAYCYQQFVISGIPNGLYAQRFSSHLTTASEIGNGGLDFQKTSTNAQLDGVGVVLPLKHEWLTTINNANGVVGLDWIFDDLANVDTGSCGMCGYVVDGTGLTVPTTVPEYLGLVRMDLTRILGHSTDHNGYFYDYFPVGTALGSVSSGPVFSIAVASSINIDGSVWALPAGGTGETGVFRISDTNIQQYCRTRFKGKVVDSSGVGVPEINVLNTRGQWQHTATDGSFEIIGYVDSTGISPSGTRIDALYYSPSDAICVFSFSYNLVPYNIAINQTGNAGTYNDSNTSPLWFFVVPIYQAANMVATLLLSDLSIPAFGRGVQIPLGIEYLDDGDRTCAVSFIENLNIKWYSETPGFNGRPIVSWSVYHEPPSFAKKWKFMRGLSSLQNQLMWDINEATPVGTDFSQNTANPSFWKFNFDNIGYYVNNLHPQAVISFTFQKGDRIRFVKDGGNNYYTVYYDVEIVRVDNADIYIDYDPNIFPSGSANAKNTLVQLYTPRPNSQVRTFFEFGETFAVKSAIFFGVRKYYHEGMTQDQSYGPLPQQIVTPATGTFRTGDQYYRLREIPIGVVTAGPTSTGNKIEYIYDQSISDFYASNDQSIGRSNTDSITIGRIDRPSAGRFTDRYISGSKINGLCAFQPLNQKQYSTDYGLCMKLVCINDDILKCVFENSFQVDIYVNKGILREAIGTGLLVAISEDVIPRSSKLLRTFGTQNPESIWRDDEGHVFGWDEKQGVKWRYSVNGLDQISDYGTKKYHKDISNARLALNQKKSQVPSVYDLYYDEYIGLWNELQPDPGEPPSVKVCLPDIDINAIASLSNTAPLLTAVFDFAGTPILLFSISKNDFAAYTDFSELVGFAINQHIGTGVTGFVAATDDDGCVTIYTPNDSVVYGQLGIQFDLSWLPGTSCDYASLGGLSGQVATFNGVVINGITYSYPATPITNLTSINTFLNSLNRGTFIAVNQIFFGDPLLQIDSLANTNTVMSWLRGDNAGTIVYQAFGQSNCIVQPLQHKYFVYNFSKGSPVGTSQTPFLQDSIAFCKHVEKNGFTSHYDYDELEMFGRIRNDVVAFKNGELWLIDALDAPDCNKFFGIYKSGFIRVPFNKDFEEVKVWNQITIDADGQWYIPRDGLTIPANRQTPQGMKSELNIDWFELIEGKYYAPLLNDTLTPNEPSYDEALNNGRELRGQAMEILLQNDDDDKTVLDSVSVGDMYSQLSG